MVTVGMPAGSSGSQALAELMVEAQENSLSPLLFGCEPKDLVTLAGWSVTEIGRQPLLKAGPEYSPNLSGPHQPAGRRELRRQARRALSKGVSIREIGGVELEEAYQQGRLDQLFFHRWQRHFLADFSFLVEPFQPPLSPHQKAFLAEDSSGQILALIVLSPSDRGWLLEHQLLHPQAPNGTGEYFLCHLLAERLSPGTLVSLGITPLFRSLTSLSDSQKPPGILSPLPRNLTKLLLRLWEPLYRFRRLLNYRLKLEPDIWEPVYWASPQRNRISELIAVLRAFSGGSLGRFAVSTVKKGLQRAAFAVPLETLRKSNLFYIVSLVFWIPILWSLDGQRLFGHPQACKAWAIYDIVLLSGFIRQHASISKSERCAATPYLMAMVLADIMVAWLLTAYYHGGIPQEQPLAAFLALINTAPVSALVFLTILTLTRIPIHGRVLQRF